LANNTTRTLRPKRVKKPKLGMTKDTLKVKGRSQEKQDKARPKYREISNKKKKRKGVLGEAGGQKEKIARGVVGFGKSPTPPVHTQTKKVKSLEGKTSQKYQTGIKATVGRRVKKNKTRQKCTEQGKRGKKGQEGVTEAQKKRDSAGLNRGGDQTG